MWTSEYRAAADRRGLRYPSDLTDAEWALVAPFDKTIHWVREVEGVRFDNYVDWLILPGAITLTTCPAIVVPCGFTASGLPVGLQIVGPPRGEGAVLAAAKAFEDAMGLAGRVPIDPR